MKWKSWFGAAIAFVYPNQIYIYILFKKMQTPRKPFTSQTTLSIIFHFINKSNMAVAIFSPVEDCTFGAPRNFDVPL